MKLTRTHAACLLLKVDYPVCQRNGAIRMARIDLKSLLAEGRVGIDEIAGYLQWGMIDWRDAGLPVETVGQITVHELSTWLEQRQDVVVVDVREPVEWLDGHIADAAHMPMFEAVRRAAELPDVAADWSLTLKWFLVVYVGLVGLFRAAA